MFPGLEFHRCGIEKILKWFVINYMWHRVSTAVHQCRILPAVKLGCLSERSLGYHIIIISDKSGMGEIDSTGLLIRKNPPPYTTFTMNPTVQ